MKSPHLDNLFNLMSVHQRPHDFINRNHCAECAEHYEALLDVHVTELEYSHVKNPGWDPTCFLTNEGFLYYFPGFVKVADTHPGWLYIFLHRLEKHLHLFSKDEKLLIEQILKSWKSQDIEVSDRVDLDRILEVIKV